MLARTTLPLLVGLVMALPGCRNKYRDDLDYSHAVKQSWELEELNYGQIVQFESVFWEPDDTISMRNAIFEDAIADGRDVLEIGTGTGLLSILCLQNGASKVVATDINPAAVANAKYNAAVLAPEQELDVRQVSKDNSGAFTVIDAKEKFDLILSNPPWQDGVVKKPADYAYYDPGFVLMTSLLDGLPNHLAPGGRCLLAYGHAPAIKRLQTEANKRGYTLKILDDRDLDSLQDDFLPGMMIEIRVPLTRTVVANGKFKTLEQSEAFSGDETASPKKNKSGDAESGKIKSNPQPAAELEKDRTS